MRYGSMLALALALALALSSAAYAGRDFTGGYLAATPAAPIITTLPITICAWFQSDTNTTDQCLSQIGSTTTTWFLQLDADGATGGDPIRAGMWDGSITFASAGTFSAGVWTHACGIFPSTSTRTAYINGTAGSADTTAHGSFSLSGSGHTEIGRQNLNGPSRVMDGKISHVCYWNATLTTEEISALARGARCNMVRPTNLIGHVPLWGFNSPDNDVAGARSWTVNSTAPAYTGAGPVGATMR